MMQRITPEEFARRHFGEYRVKGNEIQPRLCPFCRGGRKGDKYTFAMNAKTGVFNCKRGKCGVTGTFYKLLLEFGEVDEMPYEYRPQPKKRFKKSTAEIKPISSAVLEYMKLRGISKETCEAFKIGDDGKGNIVFPFFKDGKRVAVKYRPARKVKPGEQKMWREEGTDTTALFGLVPDPASGNLILTEGELDCCAIYEAIAKTLFLCQMGVRILAGWKPTGIGLNNSRKLSFAATMTNRAERWLKNSFLSLVNGAAMLLNCRTTVKMRTRSLSSTEKRPLKIL